LDHLARFIEKVVESCGRPRSKEGPGQPGFDPRVLAKVTLYAYATGVHSSRRMEQNCHEHLAYLYLVRDDRPCYRTLCSARVLYRDYFERIWVSLIGLAQVNGMACVGRIAIDSTKFSANASGDLVISERDYEALAARLREHLDAAACADSEEDKEESRRVKTETGVPAARLQMRQVVRSLDKPAAEGKASPRMVRRLEEALQTLEAAKAEGLKHVSLSDPDARMMPIGAKRRIGMGHMLEAAADSGLLVASGTSNLASDTGRLLPLLEEAEKNDPEPVAGVLADCGYYEGGVVADLLDRGLDAVIPDSVTAGAMRRPQTGPLEEPVAFEKLSDQDAYRCPQGNVLTFKQTWDSGGQTFTQYRASRSCKGCPLAERCLLSQKTKRRHLTVQSRGETLQKHLARFTQDDEFRKAYHSRGPAIETVFAFMRQILEFTRWSVRGSDRVASEGALLSAAYQMRKLHIHTGGAIKGTA